MAVIIYEHVKRTCVSSPVKFCQQHKLYVSGLEDHLIVIC